LPELLWSFIDPDIKAIDKHPLCCYLLETIMTWSKAEFPDQRFGFEITMYIANP